MIDYLFWIPVIWILSFIIHEYMHCFEHRRQTGRDSTVEIWWWHNFIPSMHVYHHGIQTDPRMVDLAGGLYTSLVHLMVLAGYVFISNGFVRNGFTFAVTGIGLIQFFYGYYEMTYLTTVDNEQYMQGHYILYFIVGTMFCIVWWLL